MELADLHECIKHYELFHVRDERKRVAPPSSSLETASRAFNSVQLRNSAKGTSGTAAAGASNARNAPFSASSSKRRHMFLSYEPNEGAVFDNTVIREGYLPVVTTHRTHDSPPPPPQQQPPTKHSIYSLETTHKEDDSSSSECTNNLQPSFARPLSMPATAPAPPANSNSRASAEHSEAPGSANGGSKPYACTFPGCNRTYKNLNGLKYHATHGHLAPSNDAEKPYECPVYACAKRYKNPNGLKYHMDHAHKNVEFG